MSPIHPPHCSGEPASGASGGHRGVEYWVVPDDHAGQRIDNFLLARLRGVPKTRIYKMLRTGEVRVNGARASSDYRLQAEDRLRIPPVRMSVSMPPGLPAPGQGSPAPRLARSIAASIGVVFDDGDVLAVSKPPGLAVHGGSGVKLGLIEALRQSRELPQTPAPGAAAPFLELVHRLDRETSGLILLARRRAALTELHRQLREGEMRKQYLALVWGDLGCAQTVIDAPLHKWVNAQGERWVRVEEGGQAAMTRVRRLGHIAHPSLGPVSLLLCEPVTGRKAAREQAMRDSVGPCIEVDVGVATRPIDQRLLARVALRRAQEHVADVRAADEVVQEFRSMLHGWLLLVGFVLQGQSTVTRWSETVVCPPIPPAATQTVSTNSE